MTNYLKLYGENKNLKTTNFAGKKTQVKIPEKQWRSHTTVSI